MPSPIECRVQEPIPAPVAASVAARQTLRRLVELRLPPTPENYARCYREVAPEAVRRGAADALECLHELTATLEQLDGAAAKRAASMREAIACADWPRVKALLVHDVVRVPQRTGAGDAQPPVHSDNAGGDPALHLCCQLLADALTAAAASCPADLAEEATALAAQARAAAYPMDVNAVAPKVLAFRDAALAAGAIEHEIQHGLLRLLQLLSANMSDLVGSDSWLHGQLKAFNALAAGSVSLETIQTLERRLHDISREQGALKRGLDDVKGAMKQMVATVIERVGALAEGTGEYHDRLARYASEMERVNDIGALSNLVVHVMNDTRGVQATLARSHDELVTARRTVEEFQQRATRLESELVVLSDRLQEDALTELLNRRGLDRMFASEASRADRRGAPLSVAMLDVDNFKALNDQFGHQAGDAALVHLAECIRATLRASDTAARYGGEEFVVLLPETPREAAVSVMTRVQRELTRRFFLHDHKRVLITFSAGVAERMTGESQSDVIARADRALYAAKSSGKNRVLGDDALA